MLILWCFYKIRKNFKADNDDQYDHQHFEIDKNDSDECEMLALLEKLLTEEK